MFYLNADGACKGNQNKGGGTGGWGYLLSDGTPTASSIIKQDCGGEAQTTNNRMELIAVIEGLGAAAAHVPPHSSLTVQTDSAYIVNTLTLRYQKNANKDLWGRLDTALALVSTKGVTVKFEWVKGHAQHAGNILADQLANQGCKCVAQPVMPTVKPSPYPRFISLEGLDGSGKTTQLLAIQEWFKSKQMETVFTREPGGTPLGETLRQLILNEDMLPETEWLLLYASRHEHLQTVIKPALLEGKWVVTDRFNDSSFAYQAAGRQLPDSLTKVIDTLIVGDFKPRLTIYLDVPISVSQARLANNATLDRLERESIDFHTRVRNAYLARAAAEPGRIRIIDASQPVAAVTAEIVKLLEQL